MSRIIMVLLLSLSAFAAAQDSAIEPRNFNSETQEKRYRALISELRCTVCQNEPIESSNAPLAADLREQVYNQLLEGRADFEIRQYMRDRYGDFVLYNPPFAGHTLILWVGPIILLLIGLITGGVMIRRRRRMLAERNSDTPS
ncbi:MAG: cytochrome c-type biogenesis protein CcmH [Wenzhouxiangellaceae bacterium]|nr:cytochrome c-type biogenesis protein CcmH [Wenzhouxiangellaceae bacterium]MBS3745594.1 cytochrome c-type biogenesis protein CcmH [Wenzhouxiangellaceae bacterium]MBS3822941.1 cytochrome c-type biogenesis protein CcmH [Wenzhouxiangellaceae bacterium]